MESTVYQNHSPELIVIETLCFDPARGLARLDRHMTRAAQTCAMLNRGFDADRAVALLKTKCGDAPLRLRLSIDVHGQLDVTAGELKPNPSFWRVAIADTAIESSDPWLRVKTSNREVYDRDRAALPENRDEYLYLNTDGAVCEGTITNIFAQINGAVFTPPIDCGLLPGVLRGEMLELGETQERVLTLNDLRGADQIWMGNSLRGLIPAQIDFT